MNDIDRQVAEKVMGWEWWTIHVVNPPTTFDHVRGDWSPSTRIDHAWEVVEWMKEYAIDCEICRTQDGGWYVGFGSRHDGSGWNGWLGYGEAETAPMAISLAALEAVK